MVIRIFQQSIFRLRTKLPIRHPNQQVTPHRIVHGEGLSNCHIHRRDPAVVLGMGQHRRVIVALLASGRVARHARAGLVGRFLALDQVVAGSWIVRTAPVVRLAVDIVLDLLIEFALVFLDIGKAEATGDLDPLKGCVLIAKRHTLRHVIRRHLARHVGMPWPWATAHDFSTIQLGIARRFQFLTVDEAYVVASEVRLQQSILRFCGSASHHRTASLRTRRQALILHANRNVGGCGAHQHPVRPAVAVAIALHAGPHPLKKAFALQGIHRGHRGRLLVLVGHIAGHGVRHAKGADAADILEADHGVLGAEVQIHLAAVVPLVERDPVFAALVPALALLGCPAGAGAAAIFLMAD